MKNNADNVQIFRVLDEIVAAGDKFNFVIADESGTVGVPGSNAGYKPFGSHGSLARLELPCRGSRRLKRWKFSV